jgi:hypothetical protein
LEGAGLEQEMRHPVRFELHGDLDPIGCDVLEIDRLVAHGECVVVPPVAADGLAEGLGAETRRPLEHHVLEQVRQARLAGDLVPAAHSVPDLEGDEGRLVILQEKNAKPVCEGLFADGALVAQGAGPGVDDRSRREKRRNGAERQDESEGAHADTFPLV